MLEICDREICPKALENLCEIQIFRDSLNNYLTLDIFYYFLLLYL
jgi:hypothetical protein